MTDGRLLCAPGVGCNQQKPAATEPATADSASQSVPVINPYARKDRSATSSAPVTNPYATNSNQSAAPSAAPVAHPAPPPAAAPVALPAEHVASRSMGDEAPPQELEEQPERRVRPPRRSPVANLDRSASLVVRRPRWPLIGGWQQRSSSANGKSSFNLVLVVLQNRQRQLNSMQQHQQLQLTPLLLRLLCHRHHHHRPQSADSNFVFVFPEGTTIGDYPDAHVLDSDEVSEPDIPVVLGEDANGDVTATFERNHIKGDSFHFMQAYKKTTKKRHGIAEYFSGALRDAIFMADPDTMEEKREELADQLYSDKKSRYHLNREEAEKEAKRRLYCPSSKVLSDVPRTIPSPKLLEERVQRVVNTCANIRDSGTGEVFFSKETWKVHNNFILKIRAGTVSDKPGFDYYYTTTNSAGKQTLWCIRGTSQLEGFHKHLRHMFPGFHTSSLLSTLLLAMFVYRWNIDRAVERGLLPEMYGGFYDHELILEMQDLSGKKTGTPDFGDFPNVHDYKDTGEKFYTPIVQSMPRPGAEGTNNEPDVNEALSPGMEFSAERDGTVLPFTPVLRSEETSVLELIALFSGNTERSVNQRTSCDYESAAETWNKQCLAELEKPFEQRQKRFPKTAGHIRSFYNKHLRDLNARATVRQSIMVDRGNGVQETVVASRELRRIQQEHQAQNLPVRAPIPMPAPQRQQTLA